MNTSKIIPAITLLTIAIPFGISIVYMNPAWFVAWLGFTLYIRKGLIDSYHTITGTGARI